MNPIQQERAHQWQHFCRETWSRIFLFERNDAWPLTHLPFTSETPSLWSRAWKCKRPESVESPWPKRQASWSRGLALAVAPQTTSCRVESGRPRSARQPRNGPSCQHSILAPQVTIISTTCSRRSAETALAVFTLFLFNETDSQKFHQPSIHTHCIGTKGHKAQNEDRQQDPTHDQHQIMIRRAAKNARILQNTT